MDIIGNLFQSQNPLYFHNLKVEDYNYIRIVMNYIKLNHNIGAIRY